MKIFLKSFPATFLASIRHSKAGSAYECGLDKCDIASGEQVVALLDFGLLVDLNQRKATVDIVWSVVLNFRTDRTMVDQC